MKVTSKVNKTHLDYMHQVFQQAQIKAVDAIKTDVQDSQTIPFDTGALQNNSMFVDSRNVKRGKVVLVHSGLPYPRRLYFHPEYNFKKDKNPKAGGMWFEPYKPEGSKAKFGQVMFTKFVKRYMK